MITGREAQEVIKGLTKYHTPQGIRKITQELKKEGVNISSFAGRALSPQQIKRLSKALVPAAQRAGVAVSLQGKDRAGFERLTRNRLIKAGLEPVDQKPTAKERELGIDWLRKNVLEKKEKPQISASDDHKAARISAFDKAPEPPELAI